MHRLGLSTILALSLLAIGSPALADDVPNDANWHIHDLPLGSTPTGAHGHHKSVVFFPQLFAQEGLVYGVNVDYVICPNATDKGLLAPGGQGVAAAGVCMNDDYVVHLRKGTEAPAGWDTVAGTQFHYKLTPRGG